MGESAAGRGAGYRSLDLAQYRVLNYVGGITCEEEGHVVSGINARFRNRDAQRCPRRCFGSPGVWERPNPSILARCVTTLDCSAALLAAFRSEGDFSAASEARTRSCNADANWSVISIHCILPERPQPERHVPGGARVCLRWTLFLRDCAGG